MGYNSAVIILHDALHNIKENPLQFTDSLVQTILKQSIGNPERPVSFGVGNHGNPVALFHTAHANEHCIYIVGGNTAHRMPGFLSIGGYMDPKEMEEKALREMADQMGYRLVKKSERKKG